MSESTTEPTTTPAARTPQLHPRYGTAAEIIATMEKRESLVALVDSQLNNDADLKKAASAMRSEKAATLSGMSLGGLVKLYVDLAGGDINEAVLEHLSDVKVNGRVIKEVQVLTDAAKEAEKAEKAAAKAKEKEEKAAAKEAEKAEKAAAKAKEKAEKAAAKEAEKAEKAAAKAKEAAEKAAEKAKEAEEKAEKAAVPLPAETTSDAFDDDMEYTDADDEDSLPGI